MLVQLLLDAYRNAPRQIAVDDGVHSISYRQLVILASVLRGVIARATTCERVGIMLPASSMFPAVLFGALWASKIAVPLNFLLSAEELARVVRHAELDLILSVNHFRDLSTKLGVRTLFLEELGLRAKLLFAFLRRLPSIPSVVPEDTAVILYTSGTTAEPKGVMLTQRNLHSNAIDAIASLEMEPRQSFLNILPPFHVFGLTGTVLVPAALAATVHAIPRFSPVAVVRAVTEKRISVLLAIPSMYAAILRTKSAKPDAFRSVTLAISGGEPLPDTIAAGFKERFGVTLRQGYGLTETSPIVAACSIRAFRDGTVGRSIRNVEVRITPPEGNAMATGQDGEILVRGPCVMKGYYKNPDETRRVIDADGWFHTGDIGRLDAVGYLAITGRAKEMLIVGGENVYPREIEAAIESHRGVLQAAVIGIQDGLRGEVPIAFVIPEPGADLTEDVLRQHARQLIAGFKVPRRIVVREDLPKGSTGKILKRRLRELL